MGISDITLVEAYLNPCHWHIPSGIDMFYLLYNYPFAWQQSILHMHTGPLWWSPIAILASSPPPAQTIALNLEKRLLEQIMTAHHAISIFMTNSIFVPSRGMLHPASLAFTDNSIFTQRIVKTIKGQDLIIQSPRQEDQAWADKLDQLSQYSYKQAASEAQDVQPITSTSYTQLDKGKGRVHDSQPNINSPSLKEFHKRPGLPRQDPAAGNKADDKGEVPTPAPSGASHQMPTRSAGSCDTQPSPLLSSHMPPPEDVQPQGPRG